MEYSAFEKVPPKARTFSWWDQFAFWFGATSLPAAWLYGALMAGWQGIAGALILIFIVNSLSFIFKLWLGWPSILDPGNVPFMTVYIAVVCAVQGYFAVKGNKMIKKLQWVATIFFLILGAYQTYVVVNHWGLAPLLEWRPQRLLMGTLGIYTFPITFALLVDLLISYNWTWEFIGDFSRFAKTKSAGTWAPFWGANLAQYWWFVVGALAVVYLTLTTGTYDPLSAAPSATSVTLGLGWLAALVVLFATITTNAANIYASALGISNILGGRKVSMD